MLASEEPRRVPSPTASGGPLEARRLETRLLLGVFVLALAVRLAYAFEIRQLPTLHQLVMDARRYDALAREILDHGWRPREAFYQAPLYPYLLAAVYAVSGRSLAAVRLVQALLGSLTAVLAAVAAGRLWLDADRRRAAVAAAIAGGLAALYAPAVFYTPLLLKTVPALFLESAALALLLPPAGRALSAARGLAAGCALGAAALLQETLLPLAAVAALFVFATSNGARVGGAGADGLRSHRPRVDGAGRDRAAGAEGGLAGRGARAAMALLAGAALALAPAALLNYAAGGEFLITSSQGGMNFYIGNARGATGTYAALSAGSQAPESQRADAQRLAAAYASRESGRPVSPAALTPARVSRILWREAGRQIAADPGAWVRLMLRKTRLFWNAYELPDAEGFRVYRRESTLLACDPVGFGLVAPLAAVGLLALAGPARGGRTGRRGALLLATLAAVTCLSVVLFFVFGRYRLAVVPFLLPLAAAGVIELIEVGFRARAPGSQRAARTALDLALLAGAGLAVNLPCYSAAEVLRQDAVIEYNLGTAATRWSEATYDEYLRLVESGRGPASAAGQLSAAGQPSAAAGQPSAGGNKPSAAARQRLAAAAVLASRAAGYLEEAARASPGFLAAELEWAIARERRGACLATAGAFEQAAADYAAARQRLAGSLAGDAGRADPELAGEARRRLAALDADTAVALNNLGVRLMAAGRFDRAEEVLARAATLSPRLPGPRGSLALCRFELGREARQRGAGAAALALFQASRDGYRLAVSLAEGAGRRDLAALYRRGLALVEEELAGSRHPT
jgi:tetratricopeptide (TPR) repeat protein